VGISHSRYGKVPSTLHGTEQNINVSKRDNLSLTPPPVSSTVSSREGVRKTFSLHLIARSCRLGSCGSCRNLNSTFGSSIPSARYPDLQAYETTPFLVCAHFSSGGTRPASCPSRTMIIFKDYYRACPRCWHLWNLISALTGI
jgi:hypothetical protein